jgi:hypothetical protein
MKSLTEKKESSKYQDEDIETVHHIIFMILGKKSLASI